MVLSNDGNAAQSSSHSITASASHSAPPVVFVTGAGGDGIGYATCLAFARAGYDVVASDIVSLDRTVDDVRATGRRSIGLTMDVCKSKDIERAVSQAMQTFGRIDVLVNNAARSLGTDILEMPTETWYANIELALNSVYLVTKAVLPHMLSSGRPSAIVNVASVNGQSGLGEEAYSAAKAGVINLTQNLAVRYGPQGVRVNCVSPGTIETALWRERLAYNPHVLENLKKHYPLGRLGKPENVAEAILFLASEKASWITGVTLNIDGGLMAGSSQLQRDLMGV